MCHRKSTLSASIGFITIVCLAGCQGSHRANLSYQEYPYSPQSRDSYSDAQLPHGVEGYKPVEEYSVPLVPPGANTHPATEASLRAPMLVSLPSNHVAPFNANHEAYSPTGPQRGVSQFNGPAFGNDSFRRSGTVSEPIETQRKFVPQPQRRKNLLARFGGGIRKLFDRSPRPAPVDHSALYGFSQQPGTAVAAPASGLPASVSQTQSDQSVSAAKAWEVAHQVGVVQQTSRQIPKSAPERDWQTYPARHHVPSNYNAVAAQPEQSAVEIEMWPYPAAVPVATGNGDVAGSETALREPIPQIPGSGHTPVDSASAASSHRPLFAREPNTIQLKTAE